QSIGACARNGLTTSGVLCYCHIRSRSRRVTNATQALGYRSFFDALSPTGSKAMNKTNAGRRYLIYGIGALVLSLVTATVRAYDWLQFGGDARHSGNNTAEATLSSANVSTLVQKYQATLPATADGAPVFLEGVTTPSGVKDLLFVTTRDGRIIAL